MDILLIDPPHIVLKNVPTDRGYNVGPASLAAYLRQAGFEAALITGDLLLDCRPKNVLLAFVQEWQTSVRDLAAGQQLIAAAVEDERHPAWQKLAELVRKHEPQAVGISYLTPLKPIVARVVKVVKGVNPDIRVILGSFHPTLCPEEAMADPLVDFVVMGEGEIPLSKLLREMKKPRPNYESIPGICYRADGAVRRNGPGELVPYLDELPFLGRDLVLGCDYQSYRVHSMITARGCPYDCAFCSDKRLWRGTVRRRSVPRVLAELHHLREHYPVDSVDFVDGTFTYDRRYVEAFCHALVGSGLDLKWRATARYDNLDEDLLRKMKRAGCQALFLGLETGSQRLLTVMNKKESLEAIVRVSEQIRASGIMTITSVLLGLPDERREDIEETLDLMRRFKTEVFDINIYAPLPGSQLYDQLSEGEKAGIDWRKVAYKSFDNHFTRNLTAGEFRRYQAEAYRLADGLRRRSIVRIGLRMLGDALARRFKHADKQKGSSPFSYS